MGPVGSPRRVERKWVGQAHRLKYPTRIRQPAGQASARPAARSLRRERPPSEATFPASLTSVSDCRKFLPRLPAFCASGREKRHESREIGGTSSCDRLYDLVREDGNGTRRRCYRPGGKRGL